MPPPPTDHVARAPDAEPGEPVIVLGEVRTSLLHNQASLSVAATEALMRLSPGAPVSRVERPVRRVVSAEQVTGIDCRLRYAAQGRGRAIGTVLSHAIATGGRVLQGSAHVILTPATTTRRREWRHYLQRPGLAETIGTASAEGVVDGFLSDLPPAQGLDLSSISARIVEHVQTSTLLDHRTPLRARTGVVRWAADLHPDHGGDPTLGIVKTTAPDLHLIRCEGRPGDLPTLMRFCEEFALHEWLLTTMQNSIVQRVERDTVRDQDRLEALAFALNQLVPLWMPPTYLSRQMNGLWDAMENRTNYSALFNNLTVRVRDRRDQLGLRPRRN